MSFECCSWKIIFQKLSGGPFLSQKKPEKSIRYLINKLLLGTYPQYFRQAQSKVFPGSNFINQEVVLHAGQLHNVSLHQLTRTPVLTRYDIVRINVNSVFYSSIAKKGNVLGLNNIFLPTNKLKIVKNICEEKYINIWIICFKVNVKLNLLKKKKY